MPSTVNGIGTTYFLKKNRCYSISHCENCGGLNWLSDYTTYKCVCFLFIPVIPYGKARVMNYCPACTRHRVMAHKDYTQAVAESLQTAHEAWKKEPDNTDALLALCDVLIATGQADQIDELLRLTQANLSADHAALIELRRYLASKRDRAALEVFQELLMRDPAQDALAVEMLRLLAVSGRKKEIPAAVATYFDANRDSVFFVANGGDLANFAKDFEMAAKCYDRLLELKPEATADLGKNKAVRKAYKKAGRPFPGDGMV